MKPSDSQTLQLDDSRKATEFLGMTTYIGSLEGSVKSLRVGMIFFVGMTALREVAYFLVGSFYNNLQKVKLPASV